LVSFALEVEPGPRLLSECLDSDGNAVTEAWFGDVTDELKIVARFEAETIRTNPFDFFLSDRGVATLPTTYDDALCSRLARFRQADSGSFAVRSFTEKVAADCGNDTLRFLPELCRRLHELCAHEVRRDGPPLPAESTLERGRGACRDVAVLFMEACRSQGLAARFVSGYQYGPEGVDRREMHAWAEVYLPGGGWRGFDPSHGLAADDRLLAVAAAAEPVHASPVSGSIRGTGATQEMDFELEIA